MLQRMGSVSKKDLSADTSFENDLRVLAEKLEDSPDDWFSRPNGWLSKPKYDRKEQETLFIKETTIDPSKKPWFRASYTKRFFILDIRERVLRYYKDSRMSLEKGSIDLSTVSEVIPSKVFDAPPGLSIDLVTNQRHYTLAAEYHVDVIRWAFAINLARNPVKRSVPVDRSSNLADSRFYRFDVTFPVKGPLHLNVMGSMNKGTKNGQLMKHWMVVIGFEKTESGGPGIAEQCGKIMKKDFIEQVNGVDISNLTFDEAMVLIAKADWPLTLRFLRDRRTANVPSEIEGWYPIFYPSLQRRRRRYVDLRGAELSFRKPAPGGAAMFHREAFFFMTCAENIQLLFDSTLPEDQQYVVRIVCREGSRVNHLDDTGEAMGGSRVRELDIFFKKPSIQEMWASKLSESLSTPIPIGSLQAVSTHDAAVLSKEEAKARPMAIWNEVTGRFATRIFFLAEGCLCWHRPATPREKARRVLLVDPSASKVTHVDAVFDTQEFSQFKYQIGLTIHTWNERLVIGLVHEDDLMGWLKRLKDVLSVSRGGGEVVPTGYVTSDTIRLTGRQGFDMGDDGLGGRGTGTHRAADNKDNNGKSEDESTNGAEIALEGYLFKRSDTSKPQLLNVWPYHKRWFVLLDTELLYFKTRLQAELGERPSGTISIRNVSIVQEAEDPSAPENSIEIVTPNRTYLMVAEDEEWQSRWLEALGDVLEARQEAVAESEVAAQGAVVEEDLTKRVIHKGPLTRKVTNRLTGMSSWKESFFVLTPGALTQYQSESDFLDAEGDCLDEIGLVAIKLVETSPDTSAKNADGRYFDIRCNVKKGGDSQGQKTINFDAKTGANAHEWMKLICETARDMELIPKENGFPGYGSVTTENHAAEVRKMSMMKRFQAFGVSTGQMSLGHGVSERSTSMSAGLGGSGSPHTPLADAPPSPPSTQGQSFRSSESIGSPASSLEVPPLPSPQSLYVRHVSLQGGRGRGTRGGRNSGR